MSVYRHLTLAEREYIMVQRARGRSITAIATAIAAALSSGEHLMKCILNRRCTWFDNSP